MTKTLLFPSLVTSFLALPSSAAPLAWAGAVLGLSRVPACVRAVPVLGAVMAVVLAVPSAAAADRMWVGFHDDPELRFDSSRTNAMDLARSNESTVLRTLVEWHRVAPERPADAADPFDPAYRFEDIDELVRNAQQRGMEVLVTLWGTPQWANGGQKPQAMPQQPTSLATPFRMASPRRETPAS